MTTAARHLQLAPEPKPMPAELPLSRTTQVDEQSVAVFINIDGTPSVLPYAQMTAEEIMQWEDPVYTAQVDHSSRRAALGFLVAPDWATFWASIGFDEDDIEE